MRSPTRPKGARFGGPGRTAAALLLLVGAGCDIPRDPETTLERVRGETVRVGVVTNEPWAGFDSGTASGVEADLVEEFAEMLQADITWIDGSEQELIAALEGFELDLVIGGLTADSPWSANVTFTRPYFTSQVVIGIPEQEEVPDDVAGIPVAAELGTEIAELVEKTDAALVRVSDISQARGAAAVETWLLDDLGLQDSGIVLKESAHVIAVAPGENAWLTELERFLAGQRQTVSHLLEQHGQP